MAFEPMDYGQLGQLEGGGQQAPSQVSGLLQMAQDAMGNASDGEQVFGNLPRIGTFEGDRSAWEYARHLQLVNKLRENNPGFQLDTDRQNALAIAGANYARGNNIKYDPTSMDMPGGGAGWGGGGGGSEPVDYGSGFRMDGKPMALSGVQGDAGRQLNRLPAALRDAFGPAVVQHIMDVGGGAGGRYPGSLAYMLGVQPFEANDSFRLNRDAWGRGFALGSSDMPHPTRPRP